MNRYIIIQLLCFFTLLFILFGCNTSESNKKTNSKVEGINNDTLRTFFRLSQTRQPYNTKSYISMFDKAKGYTKDTLMSRIIIWSMSDGDTGQLFEDQLLLYYLNKQISSNTLAKLGIVATDGNFLYSNLSPYIKSYFSNINETDNTGDYYDIFLGLLRKNNKLALQKLPSSIITCRDFNILYLYLLVNQNRIGFDRFKACRMEIKALLK